MTRYLFSATLAVCLSTPAWALDQVFTTKTTINGTIEQISPDTVSIKKAGPAGESIQVPVNEITSIKFDGEDPAVNLARSAVLDGRYADGLQRLGELEQKVESARLEVKQDVQFYKALAAAKLALSGQGDVREAGRLMRDFVEKNPGSYHYLQGAETLGDLFVAANAYDEALKYYDKLAGAPWPDFKMRAGVAKGRALQAQGKAADALAAFEAVLAMGGAEDDPLVKSQRLAATLGRASCLAATDKSAEAIKEVEAVIVAADPENAELHAAAYNTLGNCYRKAGRTKDALLAFLHVDVLYAVYPQAHAEALSNLVELWTEMKQADRAQESLEVLQSRYKDSPWAKK